MAGLKTMGAAGDNWLIASARGQWDARRARRSAPLRGQATRAWASNSATRRQLIAEDRRARRVRHADIDQRGCSRARPRRVHRRRVRGTGVPSTVKHREQLAARHAASIRRRLAQLRGRRCRRRGDHDPRRRQAPQGTKPAARYPATRRAPRPTPRPEGCENLGFGSGSGSVVLVDQPAEAVAAFDRAGGRPVGRVGWAQTEAARRALGVVVVEVVDEDAAQMPLTADQEPVEAFAAHRLNASLGVRVCDGRSHGRADHPDLLRLEDRVEHARELRVTITDQELRHLKRAGDREVAGLLGDPRSGRNAA